MAARGCMRGTNAENTLFQRSHGGMYSPPPVNSLSPLPLVRLPSGPPAPGGPEMRACCYVGQRLSPPCIVDLLVGPSRLPLTPAARRWKCHKAGPSSCGSYLFCCGHVHEFLLFLCGKILACHGQETCLATLHIEVDCTPVRLYLATQAVKVVHACDLQLT